MNAPLGTTPPDPDPLCYVFVSYIEVTVHPAVDLSTGDLFIAVVIIECDHRDQSAVVVLQLILLRRRSLSHHILDDLPVCQYQKLSVSA